MQHWKMAAALRAVGKSSDMPIPHPDPGAVEQSDRQLERAGQR